jgi:putative phosphoribosyl transferase
MRIHNRKQAGIQLAEQLRAYANRKDAIILALPRGGVPVAFEIAKALHLPLDVFLVRKLGLPGHEEFAIGAIASGGIRVMNEDALAYLPMNDPMIDALAAREEKELQRRYRAYRDDKPPTPVRDRQVILVDDGLATGSTMRAAIKALKRQNPKRIIVAVPVAPATVYEDLPETDEIVCLMTPEPFYGVSRWYTDFRQTSDEEVQALLRKAESFKTTEAA